MSYLYFLILLSLMLYICVFLYNLYQHPLPYFFISKLKSTMLHKLHHPQPASLLHPLALHHSYQMASVETIDMICYHKWNTYICSVSVSVTMCSIWQMYYRPNVAFFHEDMLITQYFDFPPSLGECDFMLLIPRVRRKMCCFSKSLI